MQYITMDENHLYLYSFIVNHKQISIKAITRREKI